MFGLLVLGGLLNGRSVARMARGDPAMATVAIVAAGAFMGFVSWMVLSLARSGMWAVHIYAMLAIVMACRRVVEAHLLAQAAEEKAQQGAPVPWLPRAASTEIVFS